MREISAKELFDNWYHTYEDDVAKMGWTVGDMVYQLLEHDVKDGDKLFEFGIGTGSLSNKFSSVANIAVSGCDEDIFPFVPNPGKNFECICTGL